MTESRATAPRRAFQVDRHSGRSNGGWRVLLDTDFRARAVQRYEKEAVALRQGTVRLVYNGAVLQSTTAPRLRSRW